MGYNRPAREGDRFVVEFKGSRFFLQPLHHGLELGFQNRKTLVATWIGGAIGEEAVERGLDGLRKRERQPVIGRSDTLQHYCADMLAMTPDVYQCSELSRGSAQHVDLSVAEGIT